jgi:tetratricopeptide (TPR) repeat protein
LVVTTSLQGDDIPIQDITDMKRKLSAYVEYYQGLGSALEDFENKVDGIDVRTEALKLLLRNFVIDRVKTLRPELNPTDLEIQLNELLIDHYNYRIIGNQINDVIISDFTDDSGNIYYSLAINDQRLRFPDFAVGQSRFITDEIEAITSEYEAAINIYQKSIEDVLEKSKVIGNDTKIDRKIQDLRQSQIDVIQAIKRNINLPKIKQSYQALVFEQA